MRNTERKVFVHLGTDLFVFWEHFNRKWALFQRQMLNCDSEVGTEERDGMLEAIRRRCPTMYVFWKR